MTFHNRRTLLNYVSLVPYSSETPATKQKLLLPVCACFTAGLSSYPRSDVWTAQKMQHWQCSGTLCACTAPFLFIPGSFMNLKVTLPMEVMEV